MMILNPHGRESPTNEIKNKMKETKGTVRCKEKERERERIYGKSRPNMRVIIGQIAMRTDEL